MTSRRCDILCFRDRTFCDANCSAECAIKLTESVLKDAEEWWGDKSAPIAVSDFSDSCETYSKETK